MSLPFPFPFPPRASGNRPRKSEQGQGAGYCGYKSRRLSRSLGRSQPLLLGCCAGLLMPCDIGSPSSLGSSYKKRLGYKAAQDKASMD